MSRVREGVGERARRRAYGEDEVLGDALLDLIDNLKDESSPVLEGPSVVVRSLVDTGGEELCGGRGRREFRANLAVLDVVLSPFFQSQRLPNPSLVFQMTYAIIGTRVPGQSPWYTVSL